jgi:hypothetical protein
MRLVAEVSDLDLLGFLAVTRRRMTVAVGASVAGAVAWGRVTSTWIHEESGNATVNLLLMVGQFLFVLLAAWVGAMLVGSLLFGMEWSDRVFLGKKPPVDEDDFVSGARFSDHTVPFYGFVLLCGLAVYGLVWVVTDDYIGRYNRHGFFATGMRSVDADDRVRGVRGLVDPFNAGAVDAPIVRALLLERLSDPAPPVRMWAAWAIGQLHVPEARHGLLQLLEDADVEVAREAAHALGRLSDPVGERRMVDLLAHTDDDARMRGLLTGLGFASTPAAAEGIAAVLPRLSSDNLVVAVWAIGRARTTSVREQVLALELDDSLLSQCLLAEAFKQVTTAADYRMLQERYREAPVDALCERVSQRELRFHDDVVAPDLVFLPRETLRQKYVIAVFNVGGPGLEDWLEDVLYDEAEQLEVRLLAERLGKVLATRPARLPRQ